MKLSTRGKYGLYAMYYLAAHAGEGPLPLQSISTMGGVPKQYLEQLLGNLRRAGLVSTVRRGPGGLPDRSCAGKRNPARYHRRGGGPHRAQRVRLGRQYLPEIRHLPVRWVWQHVTDSINSELEKIKLSDMLTQACESEEEQP